VALGARSTTVGNNSHFDVLRMVNMKMRSVATGLLITVAFVAHAADDAPHWGYGGEHGPEKWGDMEPGFSACKLGKEQSPIDIRNAKKSALPALDFKYTKSSAEVVNNGHTIQVILSMVAC
jgi:carbonic anhydrase